MGLFGKKEKIPDGIGVMYYEGNLPGFNCNFPCGLQFTGDTLKIVKNNPTVEVNLDRKRILSIDIFMQEEQYMAKYKGTNITTSKCKSVPKHYYVINYLDKEGKQSHIDFWGTSQTTGKVMKIRQELMKEQQPTTYEI